MKSLVFVLQHLLFYNFFIEITPQFAITNVWYSSFETNESDSWSVTNDNNPFQRVLYSSINGIVSSQDGNWAISAEGINCELLLPQLAYYGGTITVTFYANSPLPTVLTVRFLKINLELLQIYDVSITKSGWNMYSLSLSNVQHPAFLVSFLYRGGYQMYMDSVNIDIDGKIISCPILNTASHCGFTTETFSNYGWVFSDTAAVWNTTLGYLYLKTNFIYLGGSVTGSMNFRAAKSTVRATIEISVYQTSYSQKISSGYTDFDLTASTQYTVGQTYTLLISFFTTTIAAQLSSISMSVAGKCNLCHPVLTCNIFTNGITCACSPFSCLSPNTQCIVSTIDPSINPCSCLPGYNTDSSGNCIDINECQSSSPPCSWSNGVCSNTNGSFICSCKNGWKMGQDNASCWDINECESFAPPCSWSNGVCTNTNGSYICSCKSGWKIGQDNASCVDINECISMPLPCSWSNGVCINTNGSYFCSCKNEWRLGQDNASCVDKCNNTCVYTYSNGVYTNLCNGISSSLINTTLLNCFDVSECIKENNCSWNEGVCTNSLGSFKCLCKNEWVLKKTSCTAPSTIFSSVFKSSVKVKYIPFKDTVVFKFVEVFICRLKNLFDVINLSKCYAALQFNPSITNIVSLGTGNPKTSRKRRDVAYDNSPLNDGEIYAIFFRGYTSDGQNFTSPYSQPLLVVDPSSPCGPIDCFSYKNQTCSEVNSTYAKCYCKNGFISFDNLVTCEDINECLSVPNVCYKNSQCTNLIGSFICSCIDGYKFKDYSSGCVDINECETSCNTPNTTCINTIGSYECHCNITGSFYNTTSGLCQDLNECSSTKPCDSVRGICYNQDIFETGKPYSCSCPSGWELAKDGSNSCVDINECSTLCNGVNAFCINTVGSYKCSCAFGFSLNTSSQCQLNNCSCPLNSKCTMNGNSGCTCNFGYFPNYMSNCEVIDQCQGTKNCIKPHQFCQNVYANLSFTCLCRDGYQKVGDECIAINVSVCNQSLMNNISLCPYNQQCFDSNSSFECRCLTGYEKNEFGQCQDINECKRNISVCQPNADCINTNGSYFCKCKDGFVGKNVTNPSTMLCYTTNVWSSWEQIGTCSELCVKNEKQGKLKFQRFCEAIDFSSCNGDFFKEEMCNSELCDNKIAILKSVDCQKWPYMQANLISQSVLNNETWLKILRTWGGWKAKACGQLLTDASSLVNQDIENIVKEIKLLLDDRNTLRKVIDCNVYNEQKNSLQRQYIAMYSRLTMYSAIKATLSKLKSRIDVKLNECSRQLTMFGSYATL
nr:fibrillin-1-like isoform X10 [Hydra vulgaris]